MQGIACVKLDIDFCTKLYIMKARIFYAASLLMLFSIYFQSCTKKSSTTTPTPSTQSGFVWKEDNSSDILSDSARYVFGTGINMTFIQAYKGAQLTFHTQKHIEMNLKGQTAATYTCGSGLSDFVYWDNDTPYIGNGTVTITSFTNNMVSGSFNINITGASYSQVKGSFTNIPLQ